MKAANTRKSRGGSVEQESTSGKKLKQARLPFKILSTPSSGASEGVAATEIVKETTEARKRKLSYNEKEDTKANKKEKLSKRRSVKGDGNGAVPAKKPKEVANSSASKKATSTIVVELSDSSDSDDKPGDNNSASKENLKTTAKQKQSENKEDSNDVHSDDAELIESTDEEATKVVEKPKTTAVSTTPASNKKVKSAAAITTPNSSKKLTGKSAKKSITPQSSSRVTRKSTGDSSSACKLQIKLPISNKKSKRRKQVQKTAAIGDAQNLHVELSDDDDNVDDISKEVHPQKRPKLDLTGDNKNKVHEVSKSSVVDKKDHENNEQIKAIEKSSQNEKQKAEDVEPIPEKVSEENEQKKETTVPEVTDKIQVESTNESKHFESDDKHLESEDLVSESELCKSKSCDISSATSDVEADTEAETTVNSEKSQKKRQKTSNDITSVTDVSQSPKVTGDSNAQGIQKKILTPKQQKLHEQRLKVREEKERKIQEERLLKQREKEERELAKKREREEKEEQRRKEREEKEDQRRKEREEKERKRLAEVEAKNEEKRKRNEAKEEEQRKKDEERKRKDQEKEEAEMKKKKAAMAFTKFFSRPAQDSTGQRTGESNIAGENHEFLAFRPFQIKGDMKLAPIVRKNLTDEERTQLVSFLEAKDLHNVDGSKSPKLYLSELKTGSIKPCKWSPPAQNEVETVESKQEKDDDVIIIEDELERAGQAIVEEHNVPIERFRAKFYKFRENRRPPYFGTWRKKSSVITARRPFAQDKKFFDYEVDSDDEWEEEEPGESLDGSDDDKEKESEDEDYEVDNEWFVPHGHLSEEEMQNEDDLGESNDREAQKAKLQILQQEFAQEMKKKTEKIKPRLIGCIWVDENGNQPELCPKIIWDTLNMRAILCGEPPIMEEIRSTAEKSGESNTINGQNGEKPNAEVKLKPISLTETMLKQLIKLVHGNTHSKNFLIKEFIAYIEANEESVRNGDLRGPLKSTVREKIEEYAQWQIIETTLNNDESNKDGNKNTKTPKSKKKLCWVVTNDSLQKMNLETLGLNNNWEYILQPRTQSKVMQKEDTAPIAISNAEDSNEHSEASVEQCNAASGSVTGLRTPVHAKSNRKSDIKKFTKVLTADEKAQQLQRQTEQNKTPIVKETVNTSPVQTKSTPKSNSRKTNPNTTNQTPTVKKRVPLLISVARGQSISTPDKNARISQFLKTINDAKQKEKQENSTAAKPMETDDIVELD